MTGGVALHSLDSEVLRCQPGVVNLQHQPGIVLCGKVDLEHKRTEQSVIDKSLCAYNTTNNGV